MNTTQSLSIALLGVSGRMGRALLDAVDEAHDLSLSGALVSANSRWLNQDAGTLAGPKAAGIVVTADPVVAIRGAKVAIDFTLPQAISAIVAACAAANCPLVIGTTGHDVEQRKAIDVAAKKIPIVMAPNMGIGVNVLLKLAALAAQALDEDYDAEIFEAHHRNKKDAPSGTALAIGEVVAQARKVSLQEAAEFARHGQTGIRRRGAIGFSVLRGGDIIGDHTLTFAGPGERIEITHRSQDRTGYARGALRAARWLVDKSPGIYSMQQVLGL